MATHTPIARGAPDWQLVVGAVAIVLGLVLVIMSMRDLEPDRRARHEFTRPSTMDPTVAANRLQASSGADRRAFLLCTTIQTYTSPVSTTLTPRPGRLLSCRFVGHDCNVALGNTPEQRFLGIWSDGVPVTEPRASDAPESAASLVATPAT